MKETGSILIGLGLIAIAGVLLLKKRNGAVMPEKDSKDKEKPVALTDPTYIIPYGGYPLSYPYPYPVFPRRRRRPEFPKPPENTMPAPTPTPTPAPTPTT